MKTTYQRR